MDVHQHSSILEEKKDGTKQQKSLYTLYDTINTIYNSKKPISRILYISKTKESGVKDEKENNKIVINNIEDEIKQFFGGSDIFNCFIIFSSVNYCSVLIEVLSSDLIDSRVMKKLWSI